MTGKLGGVAVAALALACSGRVGGDAASVTGGATWAGAPAAPTGGTEDGSGGTPGVGGAPAEGGAGGRSLPDPTGGSPDGGGLATGGVGGATGGFEDAASGGSSGVVEPAPGGAAGGPSTAAGAAGAAGGPGADGGAGGDVPAVTEGGAGGAGPRLDCPLPGNACTAFEDGSWVGQRCGLVPVEGCGFAQCGGCWPGEYCSLDNWCRRYDEGCVHFGEHTEAPASVVFAPVSQVVRDGSTSVGGGSVCTLLACSSWPPMEQDILTGEVVERCPVHSSEYGTYWCREDLCPEWPSE